MKKVILSAFLIGLVISASAQNIKTPAASTTQTVKQEFGLSSIELSYSRPNMKGRKIFGDLVPYNAIWRTGANSATTLTFADEVTIGGKKIAAGKYGLLSIPNAGEWTIIITKQTDVTSPAAYKQEMDVVRVKATPQDLPFPLESFTIMFSDVKANSLNLMLIWDQTAVTLPITTDIDSKIMAQIDNALNKDNKPYFNSAMYYLENGKDLAKASEWFDKAVAQTPTAYWVWHQKANCLAKLGKKAEAIAAANKSIELAKIGKNDDYVALNNKLLATLK
jgi:tetratricopeptide (TPR) repeat protein